LDGLTYQVEKTFNENRDKLDAGAAGEVEEALKEAKAAMESNEASRMNDAFNRLQTASHKIAEALYQNTAPNEEANAAAAGASANDAGGDTAAGDDNVIDAEYVDVDDDKK
jgi:molecular chaperone DnaK